MNRSLARVTSAALLALASVALLAAPVGAWTTRISCNGNCGAWALYDNAPPPPDGATCKYSSDYFLHAISVRPPKMNGDYATRTPVAWRFKIRHASSASGPWATIFTSSWQNSTASLGAAAYPGHGFSQRTWNVASPSNLYMVWVEMAWYHSGSREGFARGEVDSYRLLYNGGTSQNVEYCTEGLG